MMPKLEDITMNLESFEFQQKIVEEVFGQNIWQVPSPEKTAAFQRAFSYIAERYQIVLWQRFGLKKSRLKIGKELRNLKTNEIGISQERVRQIEVRALRGLRHPRSSKFLKAERDI